MLVKPYRSMTPPAHRHTSHTSQLSRVVLAARRSAPRARRHRCHFCLACDLRLQTPPTQIPCPWPLSAEPTRLTPLSLSVLSADCSDWDRPRASPSALGRRPVPRPGSHIVALLRRGHPSHVHRSQSTSKQLHTWHVHVAYMWHGLGDTDATTTGTPRLTERCNVRRAAQARA
jgi:hypothetical protein